jgi:predicted CXXCH cytochrome family protein
MFRSSWTPRQLSILIAVVVLLAFTVFGGLTGLALAQEPGAPTAAPGAADPHAGLDIAAPKSQPSVKAVLQQQDPDDPSKKCAGCHAEVYDTWVGSPHHEAYSNDKFQQTWESADKDPACLQCHTTNFSPATSTYEAEGISCVECHGEIPADHPATPVNLDIANTVCKDCHTVTFAEFRASLHQDEGLACTSCHYAHENGLRLGDQVSQCTNCHSHQLDDFAHESHVNAGLVCRNCHGYVDPNQEVPVDGLVPTGHDFRESTHACLECHQNINLTASGGTGDGGSFNPGQTEQSSIQGAQAALRISELEAAYKTSVLQNRNANLVGFLEGGVIGLVVGAVVVALYSRRRRLPEQGGGTNAK